MSLRTRLIFPVIFSALGLLAGCGGNSANSITNPTAPPSGSFSASNLNGTYVFSVSGVDVNGAPYALLGTITANGTGGITAGAIDFSDADLSATVGDASVSNGSYKIGVDGRGEISLTTSVLNTMTFDFVLQNSSHGAVTEFDGIATGSGSLDLQTANASPTGTYAFNFSGADYSSGSAALFATVGDFTIGSGGSLSGVEDLNEGGFAYPNTPLSGTLALGPSASPSTVITTGLSGFANLTFDAVAIDATHLKFIEMDGLGDVAGDAYSQTSSTIPTGTLAFTLAGVYPSSGSASAAGGFMVTDGAGNITTASSEDANNSGTVSQSPLSFSGTYAATGGGRFTITLAGFSEGTSYAAYPSSGGLMLLEIDDGGIMSGAAYAQTQDALAASQGYGLNFTGVNLSATGSEVEVDDVAEFTASSGGTIAGVVDENYDPSGGPVLGLALSGNYTTPDANGRGQVGATAGTSTNNTTLNGGFTITYYSVDGTTFPFIETDANGQIASGVFFEQNATATPAAITSKPNMFVVKPLIQPRANFRKQR